MSNRLAVDTDDALLPSHYRGLASRRDRATSLALAALMVLLFALIVLRMGLLELKAPVKRDNLVAITVASSSSSAPAKPKSEAKAPKSAMQPVVQPVITPPVTPPKAVIPTNNPVPAPMIKLSGEDFAAADISKLGKGASGSGHSSKTYGPGEGPQGQQLFRAEWYREPTRAELAGYMTESSAQANWAEIACRTTENFHVDNCQSLGESPPGSGLARSLRQAAWQFLVRPPRVDGKPQIGAWVRIHFDFVRGTAR